MQAHVFADPTLDRFYCIPSLFINGYRCDLGEETLRERQRFQTILSRSVLTPPSVNISRPKYWEHRLFERYSLWEQVTSSE